ncbi:RING-type domain-containing protein [Mycena indigotica]|uniref:RING-type domain-containing protein n=1 Tax=Mycena indigotica TaxID=2126181 RepID=A0A8H6TC06_9AGAR|nr:RING-type domain-containing protein [Mycena indigotica]KAF7315748.1 RING-type domain-containing protein [Mycena indigotica]
MTSVLAGCVVDPGKSITALRALFPLKTLLEQRNRLLRRPSSTLSFASFDPRVASADNGLGMRTLSLSEELYRPKRVVIGKLVVSWAHIEDGVDDEGSFPRMVDICGQRVQCSQDLWDIYKLDPAYDCLVRVFPELSVITLAIVKPAQPQPLGKHRMSSAEPCSDVPPTKAFHLEDSEDEMSVDEYIQRGRRSVGNDRLKRQREEIERNRKSRREKGARRVEELTSRGHSVFDFSTPTTSRESPGKPKRKAASLFDSLRGHADPDYDTRYDEEDERNAMNYSPTRSAKRTRTFSPGAAKRDLETRRVEREKQKRQRREREWGFRKEQKYQQFLNELYMDIPPEPMLQPEDSDSDSDSDDEEPPVDEEAERAASIAESRRKLAELEADRPLWEQEARKREQREREEQELTRRKAAERQAAEARRVEQERRTRLEKERQKAQEEEQKRAAQQREKERKQRHARFSQGKWLPQRALEHYIVSSDTFDNAKFSDEDPIDFDSIPWPVLHPPFTFSVEDIGWAAVEAFFSEARKHMRPQDFVNLVQKSHRRFHPDRWRSRNLLKTVTSEAERECLEVATNTVAQVLSPLWTELR